MHILLDGSYDYAVEVLHVGRRLSISLSMLLTFSSGCFSIRSMKLYCVSYCDFLSIMSIHSVSIPLLANMNPWALKRYISASLPL